jgi:hypothetical protein
MPIQPRPKIKERDYSNALGGLMEVSASSPSGLYNALYKCLASKKIDESSHPARLILSKMMAMPIIHGFAPDRHLTRHVCAIHKNLGNHKSETMRIVHLVEATENQTLKIGVAWKIKQLVKRHKGIFYEFKFWKPKSTCISAIILKTLTIDSVDVTKTLHGIDETKAFDLVINGIALLDLRSIGFQESVTNMIGKTWSRRKCHVKTAFCVTKNSYSSTLVNLLYGLGRGSTPAMDLWGILHGLVMNALALSFIGILILSISNKRQHERIGEWFIDDTGLGTTKPHSTAITPATMKALTIEEIELHAKANGMHQLFLHLLNVIGGELHSRKSACFLMFHKWAVGKATLIKIHDDHP